MSSTAATVVIILGGGGRPRASANSEFESQPDDAVVAEAHAMAQLLSTFVYNHYGVRVQNVSLEEPPHGDQ